MHLFGEAANLRYELSKQKKLLEMLPKEVLEQLNEMGKGKRQNRGFVC
jgi:hypothetical protein